MRQSGRGRRAAALTLAAVAAGGLLALAGAGAGASADSQLPIPTPTLPGLPSVPLPTPTIPLPPPPTLPLPTPTLPHPTLPLPTPTLPHPTLPLPTPTLPLPSLPGPSLPLPSLPVPSLPVPGGLPGPNPGGGGSGGGGGGGGVTPGGPPAWPPGGSTTPGGPTGVPGLTAAVPLPAAPKLTATSALAQLESANPLLAARLASIVASPTALTPPDLQHFLIQVPSSDSSVTSTVQYLLAHNAVLLVVLALVLLVAVATIFEVNASPEATAWVAERWAWLRRTAAARRVEGLLGTRVGVGRRRLPAGFVLGPVVAFITLLLALFVHAHSTAQAAVPRQQLEAVTVGSGATTPAAPAAREVVPAQLQTIAAIESRVLADRQQLITSEQQVQQLAARPLAPSTPVTGALPDTAASSSSSAAAPSSGAQQGVTVPAISAAVQQHDALQQRYQQALQAEYAYFAQLAQNPAQRDAVLAAVDQLGDPQAAQAVTYDIQIVATEQAQEAAIRKAEQQAQASSLGVALVDGGSGKQLALPFRGVETQPFGPTSFSLEPPVTYAGVFYPHFHTGIDIAAPFDTPVQAAADGVVIFAGSSVNAAGQLVGYGHYLVIQHADGFETLYGHLDRILVTVGQQVTQGEVVALEGSTGWSTGPHTHFELRHDGTFIDPMPYLDGARTI